MKKLDYFILSIALVCVGLAIQDPWLRYPILFAGGWFLGAMFTNTRK